MLILIFLFGLLSLGVLLLFLLLRFGCFLLCRLFLFLWFGFFLLRSRFSLFLMLCRLSALFLVLFLRERRNSRSEKQKQSSCADNSEYFHACRLHYQNSAWRPD